MRAAGRAMTPMADLSRGVAGVRGRTLDRQPAGQPEGRARVARGDRSRAGPRPRDARRAVRSRRDAAPTATPALMFEPFADVPAYPLVFPVFWGAAAFFALAMARHLRVFAAAARRAPARSPTIPAAPRRPRPVRVRPDQDVQGPAGRADARRDLLGLRAPDDRDGQHRHRRADPGGPVGAVRRRACGRAISAMQNVVAVDRPGRDRLGVLRGGSSRGRRG